MSHLVSQAYHVTNCIAIVGQQPPAWTHLQAWPIRDDDYTTSYNGVLRTLTQQVLYFSTTLVGGSLPTKTLYPVGGQRNVNYWRAIVPLSQFNNYKIIHLKTQRTQQGVDQVTLLLVPPVLDPEHLILNQKVNEAIKKGEVTELTGTVNDYLYRNETTKEWRSNSYLPNDQQKFWVNIAVPHNIPLSGGTWDLVQHR